MERIVLITDPSVVICVGAFLLTAILIMGVLIMDAIQALNEAVAKLQETVDAIKVPENNDAAIQAAADKLNEINTTLQSKFPSNT